MAYFWVNSLASKGNSHTVLQWHFPANAILPFLASNTGCPQTKAKSMISEIKQDSQVSSTLNMLLSIIIVNWNTREHLLDCLDSIFANPTAAQMEILIVDNASTDGSAEAVANTYPLVKLIRSSENMGFAKANNRAAALSTGRYWLLLNPDTLVHSGAIDRMLHYMAEHPNVAAVGPR